MTAIIDDEIGRNKKWLSIPPRFLGNAMLLWIGVLGWCKNQKTDGFIPEHFPYPFHMTRKAVKAATKSLVNANLWRVVEDGYRFVNWDQWQKFYGRAVTGVNDAESGPCPEVSFEAPSEVPRECLESAAGDISLSLNSYLNLNSPMPSPTPRADARESVAAAELVKEFGKTYQANTDGFGWLGMPSPWMCSVLSEKYEGLKANKRQSFTDECLAFCRLVASGKKKVDSDAFNYFTKFLGQWVETERRADGNGGIRPEFARALSIREGVAQ